MGSHLQKQCTWVPIAHEPLDYEITIQNKYNITLIYALIHDAFDMVQRYKVDFSHTNPGPLKLCFNHLRVRAFFHKTVQVCHVYCIFKIDFTCGITVIFGTLEDGSLLINTLASNI